MNKKIYNNPLGQTFILAISMSLLIYFLGGGTSFLVTLLTIPLIRHTVKNGFKYGLMTSLLLSFLSSFYLGFWASVTLFIIVYPISLYISYSILTRKREGDVILFASLLLAACFLLAGFILEGDFLALTTGVEEFFKLMSEELGPSLSQLGLDKIDIESQVDALEGVKDFFLVILPAIFLISNIVTVYIVYGLSINSLNREGVTRDRIYFSRIKLDQLTIISLMVISIFSYILLWLDVAYTKELMANISFFISFLISVQGMSLVDYWLLKRGVSIFLRAIILFVILSFLGLGFIFVILGFIDIIFNFRKIGIGSSGRS